MDEEQIARFNAAQREAFDRSHHLFLVDLPDAVVERMERIVATAAIRPGEVVLDVGTGTGALIPQIRRYGPGRVFACDLSPRMLEQVARRYSEVERHLCDVRELTLPDDAVNVVFMNGMYGNIIDKEGALSNLIRMLAPGGRVVISHPEGRGFVARLARAAPFPITALPSEAEARSFLGSFGLTLSRYVDEEKLFIALAMRAPNSDASASRR